MAIHLQQRGTARRSPVANGVLIALAVLGILLGLWLLQQLRAMVVLVLIAVVIATGVDPLIERMLQWRLPPRGWQLPRALAILLVLLGALLVFGAILLFIGSVAWTQGQLLWQRLPEYASRVQGWIADLRVQYPQIPEPENLAGQVRQQLGRIGNYTWRTATAVFGVLGGVLSSLTVLVLTFYLLLEKEGVGHAFFSIIPRRRRRAISDALSEAGDRMGGWLRGQLMLAAIVVAVVSVVMWLLGMPYPLLLGLIGGIAELIPMLGPFVAGLIAVPIALLTMPMWVTISAIIFFVVLSQVEGNWLAPRIMQSQVCLSPLTTIVALLAGAGLLGVVGALLAVPLAAGLRIILIRLAVPAIQQTGQGHVEQPEGDAG